MPLYAGGTVPITLTNSGTISTAESTTGWTGDTFELEPDIKVEGSNSIACAQTTNGNNDIYFSGSWDLSDTHIRLFFNMSFVPNMASTDPIHIYLIGGSTQYIVYYATAAEYSGGWVDMLIDCELFTSVTLTAVTGVGVRVQTASKPRNQPQNTWVDHWRYSDGFEITSTTTEAVSFQDAADLDAVKPDGILSDTDGVLFASGEILLGTTGSANANIVSANEQIVYPDRFVTTSLYKLKTQEGTGDTDVDITGLICKTVGGTGAEIDFSSTLNSVSLIACVFIDMGSILFTSTVTSPVFERNSFTGCGTTSLSWDVLDSTWNDCALVTLTSPAEATGCNFIDASGSIALETTDLDLLDGCSFVSSGTGYAVDLGTIPATDTMGWNCFDSGYAAQGGTATNRTILVSVASGQTLTINVAAGASTPTYNNTGSGTVVVVSGQVTTTITVVDITTGTELQNAMVYLVAAAGGDLTVGTVIINKDLTDVNGEASDTRSYTSNQPVTGRVRRASPGYGTLYKTSPIAGTISSASGLSITVQMIRDE